MKLDANGKPIPETDDTISMTAAELSAKIDAELDNRLKQLKTNLDAAYAKLEAANAKIAKTESDAREAELQRMEKEGQKVEALEARLEERDAAIAKLNDRVVELTRDVELREKMNGLPFRNNRAADVAYREIVSNLVQNDKGVWQTSAGKSIKEYVEEFANDPEQSFLFKAKQSSGSGTESTSSGNGGGGSSGNKSLFDMPQDEVLERIRRGESRRKK